MEHLVVLYVAQNLVESYSLSSYGVGGKDFYISAYLSGSVIRSASLRIPQDQNKPYLSCGKKKLVHVHPVTAQNYYHRFSFLCFNQDPLFS